MMLLTLIVTALALLFAILLRIRRRRHKKIYFIGPHCSGKTSSIVKLLNLPNNTVSTLCTHRTIVGNTEIIELVQNDLSKDFINKFHINGIDQFIFFVKNEEELDYFPNLDGFDVKFVKWLKSESKSRKNLIYLDEDPKRLRSLLNIE